MTVETRTATGCACLRPERCVPRQHGRYLTTVFRSAFEQTGRVGTGEVSDRLDVSPASVTEMFERLAADGYLDYEKHAGVRLTPRGESVAGELVRRQCAVRTFFEAELGVSVSVETGYRIGYALPQEAVDRLRTDIDRNGEDDCRAFAPTSSP